MDTIKIGIVTASDRASLGVYEDISGKSIETVIRNYIHNPIEIFYNVIPDDYETIKQTLIRLSQKNTCDLILTTGGTGPALRDVTVEATESVCEKMLPGFGELMRSESLKYTPTAILSRQTAGICKQSLLINLPGKPTSIETCLKVVFPSVPYCLDLIGAGFIEVNTQNIHFFRPKKND